MKQERARKLLEPMNLAHVAEKLGVNKMTMYRFVDGGQMMPDNYDKLVTWLENYLKGEQS
jgi:hypothetical protein